MQQLDIFSVEQPVTNEHATGFKYRRRLYNSKENYMYTAIPSETGYRLIPVSIWIKGAEIIELTYSEYVQYLKTYSLVEKIPKDVKERMQ